MRKLNATIILTFLFLIGSGANASSIRSIDADSLLSSDHTKTYSFPAATDTLLGRASTDTLTNKSISGATNTFSLIPVTSFATGTAIGVPIGGTGLTTITAGSLLLGNGTSALNLVAPGSNGNVLTSNGSTWVSLASAGSLTPVNEAPAGSINGSNTSFTLSFAPGAASNTLLFLDGIALIPTTDYSISSTTITMVVAPALGQNLRASYAH